MFAGLVSLAFAQDGPTLSWAPVVEVRPRVMLDDRWPETLETLRARVGLQAERGVLTARVVVQDVEALTPDGPVTLPASGLDLVEGWARIHVELLDNIGTVVSVGRQAVVLDGGRILGGNDFAVHGRFVDAARVELYGHPVEVEAIALTDELGHTDGGVELLRVGADDDGPVTRYRADGLVLHRGDDPGVVTGGYARVDTGRVRVRAELYADLGDGRPSGLGAASFGWVFGREQRLGVYGALDVASGESDATQAWRPVLGDTWPWFGLTHVVQAGDPVGSVDPHVMLDARLAPPLSASLTGHVFRAADGADRGVEADAELRFAVSPLGVVGLGGGVWDGPDATPTARGYLQLDTRF